MNCIVPCALLLVEYCTIQYLFFYLEKESSIFEYSKAELGTIP